MILYVLCLVYPNLTIDKSSVFSRNLDKTNLTADAILSGGTLASSNLTSHYSPKPKEVLTFVTPWNSIGYNLTIQFGAKFTTIVPIWFRIYESSHTFYFDGLGDIQEWWLAEMRAQHPKVRIAPRLHFDFPPSGFEGNRRKDLFKFIRSNFLGLLKKYHFEGVFLEGTALLMLPRDSGGLPNVLSEIRSIVGKSCKIYLDILNDEKLPLWRTDPSFAKVLLEKMDYAFVSLYEMPRAVSLSPSDTLTATAAWSRAIKMHEKLIIGLPWFGFAYAGDNREYIFGQEFVETLEKEKTHITWNKELKEHELVYSDGKKQHWIFYPSPAFLKDRMDRSVATPFAGFGFWEVAQGLPYFFDLL
jgi:hypothetical protein